MLNFAFTNGVFPKLMKTDKILPVFKKGSKSDLSNVRPISILTQFSKRLEKLYSEVKLILGDHNIITECQYGLKIQVISWFTRCVGCFS